VTGLLSNYLNGQPLTSPRKADEAKSAFYKHWPLSDAERSAKCRYDGEGGRRQLADCRLMPRAYAAHIFISVCDGRRPEADGPGSEKRPLNCRLRLHPSLTGDLANLERLQSPLPHVDRKVWLFPNHLAASHRDRRLRATVQLHHKRCQDN